jgi:hypothetical protein
VLAARGHAGLVDDPEHQAIVMPYYRRGTLAKARTSIWYTSLSIADRLRLAQQVRTPACAGRLMMMMTTQGKQLAPV